MALALYWYTTYLHKWILLSKALGNHIFYQGDGYFWLHCCMNNLDHFTPLHTAFEQSATCLSVVVESLPGSIPFAI